MDGYSGRFECGGAVDGDALAVVTGRLLVIAARMMPRQTQNPFEPVTLATLAAGC